MNTLIIVVHVITCVFLILFVLLQAGKGAEVGATFGGISQTFFGTQGGNILSKITTVLAFVFMITSIGLVAYQHRQLSTTVMDQSVVATQPVAPATPAVPAPTTQTPTKK